MHTVFIYTLSHPITHEIRYVGRTSNLKRRYYSHLYSNDKSHKCNWIKNLKTNNLRPVIEVLDIVDSTNCIFWESYWILQCKIWGFNMLNHMDGKNGCVFGNSTSFRGEHRRTVKSFLKDGTFYCDYDSISIACSNHNKSVESAIYGKTKSANGYLWLFKDKYDIMTTAEFQKFVENCNTRILNGTSTRWKTGMTPHNINTKHTNITIEKMKASHAKQKKIIFQYDKQMVLINEFISVSDAAKCIFPLVKNDQLQKKITVLCICAKYNYTHENFKYRTAYNYIWSYIKK